MKKAEKFNAAYYQRFYFEASTQVADKAYFSRVGAFVAAYLEMLGCSADTVLDAGCGAGLMHDSLRGAWPEVAIEGFDVSAYACERYGWTCASLESFESDKTYDLVICHDVLQYLDRKAASAALEKLTRLTTTALFFGVLTREDWTDNCDQSLTDGDAYMRSSAWYARRLRGAFRNAGGGLYIKRDANVVLYSLEYI